jgi:hypothetical protein
MFDVLAVVNPVMPKNQIITYNVQNAAFFSSIGTDNVSDSALTNVNECVVRLAGFSRLTFEYHQVITCV